MKLAYKHLLNFIPSSPSIDTVSEKLFQLGHEHEIENGIFDMELTPNRGDCFSLNGLLRDLSVFFETEPLGKTYEGDIKNFEFNFVNKAVHACSSISFLKIEIESYSNKYKGLLDDYFNDLDLKKNNFFTDISNYVSYETGQPLHCYDADKLLEKDSLILEDIECNQEFKSLLGNTVKLRDKNLVFTQEGKVINLAGVVGDMSTSCTKNTKSVIVECAHFNSECIIGKSNKYDINSDAAHKFERNVDQNCHDYVLRRFLNIINEHAKVTNIKIFKENYKKHETTYITSEVGAINRILGSNIEEDDIFRILRKLGFLINNNVIAVPSYRNDIKGLNDIAEEIARVIGYDNIEMSSFKISRKNNVDNIGSIDNSIRDLLTRNGFFETINFPFISEQSSSCIAIDNPLDSTRKYLRTTTEHSLVQNLLFNERRQNDSIKLFEISNVYFYSNNKISNKKVLGIICSGRLGKNYLNFSKKINKKLLIELLGPVFESFHEEIKLISREKINSKSKNQILYLELEIDKLSMPVDLSKRDNYKKKIFRKYNPISEYPFSYRDLSYSIKSEQKYNELQKFLFNYKHSILKEVFIFDFYINEKSKEIKIGFRFIFQLSNRTITDKEVNKVINNIIRTTIIPNQVEIPGLLK
jgi:phenylalanyl-tRNA synthetase beta chain